MQQPCIAHELNPSALGAFHPAIIDKIFSEITMATLSENRQSASYLLLGPAAGMTSKAVPGLRRPSPPEGAEILDFLSLNIAKFEYNHCNIQSPDQSETLVELPILPPPHGPLFDQLCQFYDEKKTFVQNLNNFKH
jgi:hypothetical protein